MSEPHPTPPASEAATDEQRFDYGDRIAFQRPCPDCDKGLIYAPVRFCPVCGGDGYLVRWVEVAP